MTKSQQIEKDMVEAMSDVSTNSLLSWGGGGGMGSVEHKENNPHTPP